MGKSIVTEKAFDFALKIINLYKKLKDRKEYELASQILRSGTSIGANLEEAMGANQKKIFFIKFQFHIKKHEKQNIG